MTSRGLRELFSNFGVVRDVFIPYKRRKSTNTRFGFVRFDCHVAATVAAQKAHGLWVDDRKLTVKDAEFGKANGEDHWVKHNIKRKVEGKSAPEKITGINWNQGIASRSFVEVLKGVHPVGNQHTVINVEEVGNGWLYESIILRLKQLNSVQALKEEFRRKGLTDVLVREGGGRDVVITFKSKEDMRINKSMINGWFQDWCVFIKEWSTDIHFEQERYVWLSCYGVPLNVWNTNTFRRIGSLWGEVIHVDGDTCEAASFRCGKIKIATRTMEPINTTLDLDCKGRVYPIRVCEEQIVKEVKASCKCNISADDEYASSNANGGVQINGPSIEEDTDDLADAEGDDVAGNIELAEEVLPAGQGEADAAGSLLDISVVEETEEYIGKSKEADTHKAADSVGKATEAGACEAEILMKEREDLQQGCNDEVQNVGDHSPITGFVRSLSGPSRVRPGIHLVKMHCAWLCFLLSVTQLWSKWFGLYLSLHIGLILLLLISGCSTAGLVWSGAHFCGVF